MSNIIIPSDIDPIKRGKDCKDFVPLDDGTKVGEQKYCNRSFDCRQAGMKSDFVELTDPKTGKVLSSDYLCQGIYYNKRTMLPDEEAH